MNPFLSIPIVLLSTKHCRAVAPPGALLMAVPRFRKQKAVHFIIDMKRSATGKTTSWPARPSQVRGSGLRVHWLYLWADYGSISWLSSHPLCITRI